MNKPEQILGALSGLGEILAVLNKLPWNNAYATLICGIVCAIILALILARRGHGIWAG